MTSNADVTNADERLPWRLVVSLVIGPASWLLPHQGAIATLLPQKISEIDPVNKVPLVMMFSTVAMIVALVLEHRAGCLLGSAPARDSVSASRGLSDVPPSCLVLLIDSRAETIPVMLAWWCVYEFVVNGVAAAIVAQLSDRVPARWRGTASSAYGLGQTIGGQAGILVAAQFLGDVTLGVEVFAAIALIGGVVSALLAGERSNLHEPVAPFSKRELVTMSMFPTRNATDFYKTLAARFLLVVGSSMVSNYMLYILQDYLGLDQAGAQRLLSVNSSITLIIGLVCCLGAGPLADRIGRPKQLAVATTGMIAVGALVPFVFPTPAGLYRLLDHCRHRHWRELLADPDNQRHRAAQPRGGRQGPGFPEPSQHFGRCWCFVRCRVGDRPVRVWCRVCGPSRGCVAE